jgi:hypothetical protein
MASLELYFGHPQKEKSWDGVEDCAYNQEINIESAVIRGFQAVNSVLTKPNEQGDNYFELVLMCLTRCSYKFPRVTTGVYKRRGFVYPKLVIHGDTLKDKGSGKRTFLTDEFIEYIGKEFDSDFDYEYFDFKRFGVASLLNDEVIYLLHEKPHIYQSGKFIEQRYKND